MRKYLLIVSCLGILFEINFGTYAYCSQNNNSYNISSQTSSYIADAQGEVNCSNTILYRSNSMNNLNNTFGLDSSYDTIESTSAEFISLNNTNINLVNDCLSEVKSISSEPIKHNINFNNKYNYGNLLILNNYSFFTDSRSCSYCIASPCNSISINNNNEQYIDLDNVLNEDIAFLEHYLQLFKNS